MPRPRPSRPRANARALAGFNWAANRIDASLNVFNGLYNQSDYDIAVAAADDERDGDHLTAEVTFVTAIGDAQIARAGGFGDSLITYVTAMGDARIAYTNAANTTETGYASAVSPAEIAFATSTTSSRTTLTNSLALAQQALTSGLGAIDSVLFSAVGESAVSLDTSVAEAQASYQVNMESQRAARFDSWAAQEQSDDAEFLKAQANARADWASSVEANFSTHVAGFSQAEADFRAARIDSSIELAVHQDDALVAYASAVAPLTAGRTVDIIGQHRSFEEGRIARQGVRDQSLTVAAKVRDIALASDIKLYAVAVAAAEKEYQLNLVQESAGDHLADRDRAIADASLESATRQADAEKQWLISKAGVDKTLIGDHSTSVKGLKGTLAQLDKSHLNAVAAQDATLDTSLAMAKTGYLSSLVDATGSLDTAYANVTAASQGDHYVALSSSMTGLATGLGTPWAQFQADLTSSVRDWWTDEEQSYKDFAANSAAERATYQATANSSYTTRANQEVAANVASSSADGDAIQAQAIATALAHDTFVQSLLAPTESYAIGLAEAKRDYKVAMATAAHNLAFGAVNGVPYGQSEYDDAIALAESQYQTALTNAAESFASSQAGAGNDRRTSLAEADADYQTARSNSQTTWVAAYQSAGQTFNAIVAAATTLYKNNTGNLNASYLDGKNQSLATSLSDLATTSNTPWAQWNADQTQASAALKFERRVSKPDPEVCQDQRHGTVTNLGRRQRAVLCKLHCRGNKRPRYCDGNRFFRTCVGVLFGHLRARRGRQPQAAVAGCSAAAAIRRCSFSQSCRRRRLCWIVCRWCGKQWLGNLHRRRGRTRNRF